MHYYYKKYPYLNYHFRDDNTEWTMFSVPPEMLVSAFYEHFGFLPKTFFDCGAAVGEIVYRAEKLGLNATGIDIKRYSYQNERLEKLFNDGKIQIKSILDCEPIKSDLVYCNGTLTYFCEQELPSVLKKFNKSKMLAAIHNTSEDIIAAKKQGDILLHPDKPRLIKPLNWWIKTFYRNGYNVEYDQKTGCFFAFSRTR